MAKVRKAQQGPRSWALCVPGPSNITTGNGIRDTGPDAAPPGVTFQLANIHEVKFQEVPETPQVPGPLKACQAAQHWRTGPDARLLVMPLEVQQVAVFWTQGLPLCLIPPTGRTGQEVASGSET